MEQTEITQYLDMAKRRKYWIIIPFLLSVLVGLTYYLKAPRIFESKTLILVQPQRVPEEFVRSIVSTSVEDRVRTITQQVTSRTNLENIINEYQLIRTNHEIYTIDAMVISIRKRISIEVEGGGRNKETSTFTIAFRDRDPETSMRVTNALASNFMAENLKIREAQALGTSAFLADELESVKNRLLKKETDLKEYREHYMGGLPEQLQTNLSILGRLQSQLDQLHNNLRDAENRKIIIQTQLSEQAKNDSASTGLSINRRNETIDLQSLKVELASLEARYTSKHPDIRRLKETIARLENEQITPGTSSKSSRIASSFSGVELTLKQQFQNLDLEIARFKEEIKKTRSQIDFYQKKVEDTPKREQELLSLNRDYENLRDVYNSLLNRKLEAEIAVSMEKKQKGEQFKVIDPAKMPTYPVEPDVRRILLMVLMLGLGLGGGLAYITERMDSSFKTPEELEKGLKLPVLISMPINYTEKELRFRRIKKAFAAASVTLGFVLSSCAIILAIKGVDISVNYVKNLLDKI